jgi:hypothetical protein
MKISCLHDRYCIASFEPALSPESGGDRYYSFSSLKRAETMGYTGGLHDSNQYDRMLGSTGTVGSGSTCARIRARGHSAF